MQSNDIQSMLDQLADAGLTISIAYGYCGNLGKRFSIDILNNKTLETFPKPFAADSIEQAVSIAILESQKRGWIERS